MEADAIYDFSANADDELGFKKGGFLKILCVEEDPNCRLEAEERLLEIDPATNTHLQPDGAFLLRRSEADGKGFSLSVK
ncbi:unnamed protein product [Echinostoma caproni]|uniref:SH3 domain-containing protein n=1 Tax=Echinostoma caproni TaxID=27848 RepID=A0A183ATK7_9TREM|nr:unnamed protein product [Echinostoma caproni]